MDEITGPVLAITLVLSSVFIPCCFLGGISGQFFRQFAVTIAVSTIISAINALTMTPSRAVLIFKDRGAMARAPQEALPWWIFGMMGGIAHVFAGPEFLADLGLPRRWQPPSSCHVAVSTPVNAAYFLPGVLAGGVVGWFLIRPVNAVLGCLFRGFNRGFDCMTAMYGRDGRPHAALSAMVLVVYGGLLGLTYWQFQRTPTGFIPQQDKGYLILNVQLPDSASVERTRAGRWPASSRIAREHAGVAHTVGISGQSLILNANAPNLGSMYVMLEAVRQAHGADLSADAIAAAIAEALPRGSARGDRVRRSARRRSTAWAPPAASS